MNAILQLTNRESNNKKNKIKYKNKLFDRAMPKHFVLLLFNDIFKTYKFNFYHRDIFFVVSCDSNMPFTME